MPSKKRQPEPSLQSIFDEMRSHSVILEDMRAQNRATIEAVEATRMALEQRIDQLDRETRARDAALELAIRDLRVGLQQNTVSVQQNTVDIRDLAARVQALARIEERVAALERRSA